VLLDGQFAAMPGVVAEGRRVIANVERVSNLFVTKTVYAMLLAIAVGVARWPYPFRPRHLTIISSLTIGIPAFFLALGPNLRRYQPGFVRRVLHFSVPAGFIAAAATFAGYWIARRADGVSPDEARTGGDHRALLRRAVDPRAPGAAVDERADHAARRDGRGLPGRGDDQRRAALLRT
jgi:cation-transporting ATPase E